MSFENSVEHSVSLRAASFISAINKKNVIVFLCFLFSALQAFAISYEDGQIKTTAREVTRLQELLKGTPYEVSPEQFRQRELKFVDAQMNHILRVTDGTQRILQDARFQKEFPRESKILLAFPEQTVRQSLTHDLGKFLKETTEANRGLILSQGLNYRQMLSGNDPHLSAEKAREVGNLIKNYFIHDVNVGEARAVNGSFQKLMPNHSEFKRAHELLTAVYDWYDSAVNRIDIGSNRKNTYDWVKQLQQEGAFDDTSKKDVRFMEKAARYVDEVDLLRQSHYKKVIHPNLKIGPFNTVAEYQKAFEARSEHLAERAKRHASIKEASKKFAKSSRAAASRKVADTKEIGKAPERKLSQNDQPSKPKAYELNPISRTARSLAGLASGTVGKVAHVASIPGVATAVEHLLDPESANLTDTLASLTGTKVDFICDTIGCHQFIKECAGLLKMKPDSQHYEVQRHPNFEKVCIKRFFSKPLHEQAKEREDHNLDMLLSKYAPAIRDLKCTANPKAEIHVQLQGRGNKELEDFQRIIFGQDQRVEKVVRNSEDSASSQLLQFANSRPDRLRTCEKPVHLTSPICKNYPIDYVRKADLFFYARDRKQLLWARNTDRLVSYQMNEIKKCCDNTICENFFSERIEKFETVRRRQSQTAGIR